MIEGTTISAIVEAERDRANVMAMMSILDATMECTRRIRVADGLRNGPVARRGARSHRVWREHLAVQLASPPLLAVIMALAVQSSAQYASISDLFGGES